MHEATFRIRGRGAFADITRDVDATVELWCNDHCDLLRVSGDTERALRDGVADLTGVQDTVAEGDEEVIITEDCLERHEVTMVDTYLARHDCLMLPPLTYERGHKTCRVLALDPENLTNFYRDLVEQTGVTVESKREVGGLVHSAPLLTLDDTIPALSDRQREVLLRAYKLGYYRIPRETTTEEIAESVGVTRRTAEQHLRRAENKLIDALADVISPLAARD